ncbi:MAG: GNAT family N-acyltransferase [Litoreibacter sp.]
MAANSRKIEVRLAKTDDELRAAARLRYDVFVRELGGDGVGVDHQAQLETDRFDSYVDHLIAVDRGANDRVVGVYRLMRDDMLEGAGQFYSESEYDLTVLRASKRKLLELGRSCVHANYRNGTTMYYLWQGLAEYIERHKIEVLFGVASFHGTDPSVLAQPLSNLSSAYLAPVSLRATSRKYVDMNLVAAGDIDRARAMHETPALIKAYLRLGGLVGDGAYIDHDFNTVDVCLVMDTQKLSVKHREIYAKGRRQ